MRTADDMHQDEQDEIQEDTTSMEEKLEALNQTQEKEAWMVEFDREFSFLHVVTGIENGAAVVELEHERVKAFIQEQISLAKKEQLERIEKASGEHFQMMMSSDGEQQWYDATRCSKATIESILQEERKRL